jgi:hypothetical protein
MAREQVARLSNGGRGSTPLKNAQSTASLCYRGSWELGLDKVRDTADTEAKLFRNSPGITP